MKSVLLSGYYGFGNLGDELILKNIATLFREMGFTSIYAVSGDIEYSKAKHPDIEFIDRDNYSTIVNTVKKVDLVVLGGGGLFQDYNRLTTPGFFEYPQMGVHSYINVPLIAHIYGKPVAYLFQGLGPLFSEDSRNFTRYAYSLSNYISVRNRESVSLLEELGIQDVILSSDPCFLFPVERGETKKERPRVAISLRQWVDKGLEERIIRAISGFLNTLSLEYDPYFISFQDHDEGNTDSSIYGRIEADLKEGRALNLIRSKDHSLEEIERLVSGFDFVIGMRLHSIILAIKYGIPFLAIPYWNKVESLLNETGLEDLLIPLNEISSERIGQRFLSIISESIDLKKKIEKGRSVVEERLKLDIDHFRDFVKGIAEVKTFPVPVEKPDEISPLPPDWINYKSYQERLKRQFSSKRYSPFQIRRILNRSNFKKIIFYPSPILWDVPLFQRPHQIFKELSKRGYLIFFLSPDPKADRAEPIREINENLYLIKDIDMLYCLKDEPIVLWITWTPNIVCNELFPNSVVVYDWIDELDVFGYYSKFMEIDHRKLLHRADVIFATSDSLLEEAKTLRPDALLIPNGVCMEDFEVEGDIIPEDMAGILAQGKPVIGFYGLLAEWRMDYDLVNYLCGECRDLNFVLIGPSYDGSSKKLRPSKNLFLLGPKKYEELKYYLKHFDVSMIPYKVDRITNSVFPVKLCEYMAGGKLVVTTDMKECRKFKSVLISENYEDFIKNIRKALLLKDNSDYLRVLAGEAYSNRWEDRVDKIITALDSERPLEQAEKERIEEHLSIAVEEIEAMQKLLDQSIYEIDVLNSKLNQTMVERDNLWNQLNQTITEKEEKILGLLAKYEEQESKVASKNNMQTVQMAPLKSVHKFALKAILKENQDIKGIIVYAPAMEWSVPLLQRPQHLAFQMAAKGYLYFYCTSNVNYDKIYGFEKITDRCYVTDQHDLITQGYIPFIYNLNSICPRKIDSDIFERINENHITIYDYIDHIHEYISGPAAEFIYRRHMLINPDIITCTAQVLVDEMLQRFPSDKVYYLPNAVEYEHFHIKREVADLPEDIKHIVNKNKPIIGYFGALAKWIDYDLINLLAEKRPDAEIILIGWDYDGSQKLLKDRANLHILGTRPYAILPKYAIWFDIAIIPFSDPDISSTTSPIKLYEYMALGKPIVTTDVFECKRYRSVMAAQDHKEFLLLVDRGFKLKDDEDYLKLLDFEAKQNTWEARASELEKAIVLRQQRVDNMGYRFHYIKEPLVVHEPNDRQPLSSKSSEILEAEKVGRDSCKYNTPMVSIIIPTCNRPHFLKEALESVLSQTYKNYEIIVISDGGKDDSPMINTLDHGGKIIYLRQEESRGPSATRNTGLKAARGKYIAYLDDDDIYYPTHLETLIPFLERNNYRVAYTDSYQASQTWITDRYVITDKEIKYNFDFDRERFLVSNYIHIISIVHRRELLDEVGLFDEKLETHEDWDLCIRLSQASDFYHIPKATAEFRVRDDMTNAITSKSESLFETLKLIHKRYSHLVSQNEIFQDQKKIERTFEAKAEISRWHKSFLQYTPLHFYRLGKEFVKGKKVLDLECSKGHGSFLLAEDAGSVIALDENERSIRYASSHFLKENLAFRKGSLSDQSREGQALFDVIIWFRSMSNITELEKQLPMIHRFLKEGGIFLVSLPNKRNDLSSLNYPLGYRSSLNEFKSLLNKYFEYTLMYGQKIYPSSNIFPLFNTSESAREYLIEKGEENFLFVSPERKEAEYLIAVSSNRPLQTAIADSYLFDASESFFKFKEAQIKSLEEEPCDKEAYIENLELVMSEKDIHIGNLEAAIRDKDNYIGNLERQREENYQDWQAHEKNLRTIIEDKDTHIGNLEAAIRDKDNYIGNLERQREQSYRDWQAHEKNLRTIIEDKDTHIGNLEAAIRDKDNYIGNLERHREENYRDWQAHENNLRTIIEDKADPYRKPRSCNKGEGCLYNGP